MTPQYSVWSEKRLKYGDMKARKVTSTKSNEEKSILSIGEAKDNVCDFFRLLLEIDKRNNPGLYENQKSRNRSHPPC